MQVLALINLLLSILKIVNTYDLNRTIENYGFHRKLLTRLDFKLKKENECKFLFIEQFTSNSFVDKYELAKNRIDFLLNTKIDIEKAEYESDPFDLLIYPQCTCNINNECQINVKLPFNIRYHKPSLNGSVRFRFQDVQIYQLDKNNEELTRRLPCDSKSPTNYCTWSPISYTRLHSKELMIIQVPVVRDDTHVVILIVSLLAIFGCLACLIKASCDKVNNVIFYVHNTQGKITKYNLFNTNS
jgi:hypothetical protein